MCKDEGSEATDRPTIATPTAARLITPIRYLQGRATADENGRWGVAAGILNIKGCGERGNP